MKAFKISLDEIKERANAKSFTRGSEYYRTGAIDDPVLRGNVIEASCQGSMRKPYQVRAVLGETGVISATCTCDYDFGGDCKHIVALMLTYLKNPDVFVERAPLADVLALRSKEDLIAIINLMLQRYPDLQTLVDYPLPSAGQQSPVSLDIFRREIHSTLQSYSQYEYGEWDEYPDDERIYKTIDTIAKTADKFGKQGDWKNASAIYRVVIEEATAGEDDSGYLDEALYPVTEGLALCLEQNMLADDDNERRLILNSLLQLYLWNINATGSDTGIEKTILKFTRQSDAAMLRQQIMQAEKHSHYTYRRSASRIYESFLAGLDILESVDPEVTLKRLFASGLYDIAVQHLLRLGRTEEAINTLRKNIPTIAERLNLLPGILQAGYEDVAIQMGEEWLYEHYDEYLLKWLTERYQRRNDFVNLLRLQVQQMHLMPGLQSYELIRQTATRAGQWDKVHSEIIQMLEQRRRYDVLVYIALLEKDDDAAWKAVKKLNQIPEGTVGYNRSEPLDLRVAEKTRATHPEKALPVFMRHARLAIGERKRDAYALAAEYLAIARELYLDTGEEEAWLMAIANIRQEFKSLRALQEELNRAGLEK